MFQESELINLCISLISFAIVMQAILKREIPDFTMFYAGFCCIFAASVFTVAEGILWHDFFNTFEHLSYGLAGITFAVGCFLSAGEDTGKEEVQSQ